MLKRYTAGARLFSSLNVKIPERSKNYFAKNCIILKPQEV